MNGIEISLSGYTNVLVSAFTARGLESAIRAKAAILVTGDKDLLDISKKVPQLRIISPRGFWELLPK